MSTLRVAGVPEHFNLPFQSGVQRGIFSQNGINLLWNAVPGGTGAMVQLVSSGEADVAVALTEGVVAAIVSANINAEKFRKENSSSSSSNPPPPPLLRCAGEFVASKLRWMVAAGVRHECSSLEDIGQMLARDPTRILRFSVSRLGSGSHLMAYLLAKRQGWPQDRLQFIVQKDFRTMRRGVGEERQSGGENEPADLLMWEWYMTKPFVDALELKALGFFDTPWHCFSFIARKDWLDVAANRELLKKASSIVFSLCREMMEKEDASCEEISAHFGIDLVDAHSWFNKVRYAQELVMPKAMVERVLEALASVGVIPPVLTTKKETLNDDNNGGIEYDLQDIVDTRVARILQLDASVTSNRSSNYMSANEIIEDEADEEWERNVPMVSSRVVQSSSTSSSSFLPYVESERLLISASCGGSGSATGSGGITSTSEISLSFFDIGQQGISTNNTCLDDHHPQQLQQPREVFLSTLSPGDSIIGAAHVRVKRDAAMGVANERRASIERRASVGGGGGDMQLRKSFVGVSETEDDADEDEVVDVDDGDVENYKDIEEVVDEEGDNEKSKEGRRNSGVMKLRSALPLPSTPSSSTLSPSYASSSFSSFSPPQLRMPTKDSLVPTAGTTEYTLWKGKKRAALEAVLGHLDSYGGQTASAANHGRNSYASHRGEDSFQTGGADFSSSSISLSTRTVVTPAQAVNVTRLNWIASGAAVDIG